MSIDRVFFMNVGWMSGYRGMDGDSITGGGKHVEEHRFGHEILNFLPYRGRNYGYGTAANDVIALERIAATNGADYLDGVLVVWVARSVVVGWYQNARLYRKWQDPPVGSNRVYQNDPIGYYATAKTSDCTLLDRDARMLRVPRAREVEGGMGRYVWYAEDPLHRGFLQRLFALVESGGKMPRRKSAKRAGRAWQADPRKRKKVEDAAIREVIRYYDSLGYHIKDRQPDNAGWDLEAEKDGVSLLLEVKGLSGPDITVELTANEYAQMKSPSYRSSYRICIVKNALSRNLNLSIFNYCAESKLWIHHAEDKALTVEPRIVETARLFL
ncbi:MAG TPA: DUF3883 domain-containing protein [Bryobacterales bacterium]|nr:DUF3883 domain-containing protein [Bryobacterales bacterium]